MSDEELLIKYHKYKRKRMIIISIIILFFILIAGSFLYFHFNNTSSPNVEDSKDNIEIKDEVAPIIKLKLEKLEIMKGDDINYLDYVESVVDDVDGDLLEKLKYEEIDNSIVGEQSILYNVSDSSGNSSQSVLQVIISEPEEQKEEEIKEENNSPVERITPPSVESNSKKENNNPTPKVEQPQVQETPKTENSNSGKIVKYFLFSDGYTMMNVADACATELKKTNKTGMCSPIQDENGIYLGMKLETN